MGFPVPRTCLRMRRAGVSCGQTCLETGAAGAPRTPSPSSAPGQPPFLDKTRAPNSSRHVQAFCCICPLITPVAFLYFASAYLVK